MDITKLIMEIGTVLASSKVGLLATVDAHGRPRMRWMTPVLMRGRNGYIYALTSPKFRKRLEADTHKEVQWIFQTRVLDRVVTVNGDMTVIDNPALKAEVIESIGRNLDIFWRVNPGAGDVIILETHILSGELFLPLEGKREHYAGEGGDA